MRYQFDDFELDTDTYELRRRGLVRHIEPLVFDVLLFLARNPGRLVSRDEMIEHVWKGRIVSDATVSSCIKSARRVLGDDGDSQTYIRTIRGRGFSFVAAVSVADGADTSSEPAPAPASGSPATSPTADAPEARHRPPILPGNGGQPPGRRSRATDRPILAVLPFENLSAGVDQYFADGLTEDIITNLSRFRELQVIARATTFQFKGRPIHLQELSALLGAGYFVLGSVRRAAGRVRISAQLIDGDSGLHLWADRYDGEMCDIFELQDEVTRKIAATLGLKIQDVALQRALRKSAAELDAYDCLLRARRFTSMLSADIHAEARDLLEAAIALDPTSADAHALLANVYLAEHRFETNPRPDPIGRALHMAATATRLDPQNAYARCWLAIVHFFRRENDKFETEAQLALSLNPNDPEILADVGHYLAFMGQFERGVDLSKRAQQLNPLHPGWYYFAASRYHYDQRAYADTNADVERAGMPHFYWSHLLQAAALAQLGRAEAGAALARVYDIKPGFSAPLELRKWNAAAHDFEHLMEGLRKAGLKG